MFDALWVELPSQSDLASRYYSTFPAFEAPSFEMPSFSGIGCTERAKRSESKEFLYAHDAEQSTPHDEEDADGIVYSSSMSSMSMSLELDSETAEARIFGAASPSRASSRQPPYVPKLTLRKVDFGLKAVGAASTSEQPSQPLSGRWSARSVKSLSGWYLDSDRCSLGESTCASDMDHCDDMPKTTTSAWFLDGHKPLSARTPETACFKMSSTAPDYPESSTKSLSGWYLDSNRCNSGRPSVDCRCNSGRPSVDCGETERLPNSETASNMDNTHDMPQTTTSAWFLDGHKLPSARTSETACFKMSSAAPDY